MQFMHDQIVSRMKMLAKIYKEKGPEATVMLGPNNDRKVKVVDTLKILTKKKRELEDALQNKVAGIGQDQELAEGRGDMEEIHAIIRQRAIDSGETTPIEAAEIIMDLADTYGIELDTIKQDYFEEGKNIDKGDSLEDIKKTAMSQLGGPDTPVVLIHDPEAGDRKKYNTTLQKALAYFEKQLPNEPSSVEEPYILKKGRDVGYEEGKAQISIEGHLFDIIKKGVAEKKGKYKSDAQRKAIYATKAEKEKNEEKRS